MRASGRFLFVSSSAKHQKAFHGRYLVFMARPVRPSPGRWGLARGLPEVLAQVRVVGETAPQGNVAQGRIGGKHVLGGQFHAPPHDESVR